MYRFLEDDIYRKKLTFTLVMEMQSIEIPEFPRLRGEKAIRALYDFINELEGQRGNELTEKQTAALIKLAKGLILSIETEARSDTSDKNIVRVHGMNSTDLFLWRYFPIRSKQPQRTFL